ncbi:MAG: hypothetical protein ACI85K_000353 [Hyphomicrobiaceae bacterium]|jgi:hypothetical protein
MGLPLRKLMLLALILAVNVNAQNWRQVLGGPLVIGGAAMAYDEANGLAIAFGGLVATSTGLTESDETWLWDGLQWTLIGPFPTQPSARAGSAMSYDSLRQRIVLFGGTQGGTWLNDTWEWDGAQWLAISTAASPSSRREMGMAFDGSRTILFGGQDAITALDDQTWSFDGLNWVQLNPSNRPSKRSRFGMAGRANEILLFGGQSQSGFSGETWRWNGSDWNQLSAGLVPGAYADAGLTYDTANARYLLHKPGGGLISQPATYARIGGAWTNLAAPGAPSYAMRGANAFHAAVGRWVAVSGGTHEFGDDLASIARYGTQCAPGGSAILQLNWLGAFPAVGSTIDFELAPAHGLPLVSIGFTNQTASLTSVGTHTGCFLYHSADLITVLPWQSQPTPLPFSVDVPNDPLLVGQSFYLQGFDLPLLELATMRVTFPWACTIGLQ